MPGDVTPIKLVEDPKTYININKVAEFAKTDKKGEQLINQLKTATFAQLATLHEQAKQGQVGKNRIAEGLPSKAECKKVDDFVKQAEKKHYLTFLEGAKMFEKDPAREELIGRMPEFKSYCRSEGILPTDDSAIHDYLNHLMNYASMDPNRSTHASNREMLLIENIIRLRNEAEELPNDLRDLVKKEPKHTESALVQSRLFKSYLASRGFSVVNDPQEVTKYYLVSNKKDTIIDETTLKGAMINGFIGSLERRLQNEYNGHDKPTMADIRALVDALSMAKMGIQVCGSLRCNQEMDTVENDQPEEKKKIGPTNILANQEAFGKTLPHPKKATELRTESGAVHKMNLSTKPYNLQKYITDGEVMEIARVTQCGDKYLPVASLLRANQPPGNREPKPTQDLNSYQPIPFILPNGKRVVTNLLVSNDGNAGHACVRHYADRAAMYFTDEMESRLNKLGVPNDEISDETIKSALAATHNRIEEEWMEAVRSNKTEEPASNTTSHLIFLCPGKGDELRGVCFLKGDTRTIVLKPDGTCERIGSVAQGMQVGTFNLEPDSYLFVSSDGIWHNASPNQVNKFLKKELQTIKNEAPKISEEEAMMNEMINELLTIKDEYPKISEEEAMKKALHNLVFATLPGRPDDRNPMMLYNPPKK